MKKFLKFLSLTVLICALVCVFVACDEEPTTPKDAFIDEQGVAYMLNADNSEYAVVAFSSYTESTETNVVIPEEIEGKPVVAIDTGAFYGSNNIISVTIPSTVTTINEGAFGGCAKLEEVLFEENSNITAIGASAFKDCIKLSDLALPNRLLTVGAHAFEGCISLTKMEIPSSVKTLSSYAFRDCIAIKEVTFGDESTLTRIGEETFCGCMSLTSITLPTTLTNIDNSAFFGCSTLASLELPENLISIKGYAFYGCEALTEIVIPSTVEEIGVSSFNNCKRLGRVVFDGDSNITKIQAQSFENCVALTDFDVPNRVKIIDEQAFYNCKKLNTITFGDASTLEIIGSNVFVGCNVLEEISIPKSVVSIKSGAFESCKNLTTVSIPDDSKLVDIGEKAFFDCDKLNSIAFGQLGLLREIGASAFYDCDALMSVDFGEYSTLKKIGQEAFYDCNLLFSFTIPIEVTSIDKDAFKNCYRLVEVNNLSMNFNVEKGSLDNGGVATYAKDVVNSVSYESRITIDGDGFVIYANGANVSLVGYIGDETEIVVPLEINEVNGYAFYKNNTLKDVDYEKYSRLYTISKSAFEGCSRLESINIPESVMTIDANAFKNCKAVNNIYYNAKKCENMTEDTEAFFGVGTSTSGVELTIGSNVEKLPDYIFYSQKNEPTPDDDLTLGDLIEGIVDSIAQQDEATPKIVSIEYGKGCQLDKIGNYAFANNKYLSTITIPSKLTQIGDSAFENCTALSIKFSKDDTLILKNIGASAFKNCINMTSFKLVESIEVISDGAFSDCYRLTEIIDKNNYLNVTVGSEEYGSIAKHAIVVHDGNILGDEESESVITTDDDGYVVLTNGNKKILVNYVGSDTELIVPQAITNVNAFALCDITNLTSVEFGANSALTTIGDSAFLNCSALERVEIPQNTVTVGDGIFIGCTSLNTVYYNAINCTSINSDTVIFNGTGDKGINLIVGNTVEVIPSYLCCATQLKSDFVIVSIEFEDFSKCTTIGDYAFAGEEMILSVDIPDSVTTIGNYAFKGCTSINELKISQTSELRVIGEKAFENCMSIAELSLPSKVNEIASGAFDGASKGLLQISVASENPTYHSKGNCLVETATNTLILGCKNSQIPNYIVTISDCAFKNCSELKKITIPESVKSIGNEAFYYCKGMEEITIEGEMLESIGHDAFDYCLNLQKINLPKSIKSIGAHAFLYCKSLKDVTYDGTVEEWKKVMLGKEWCHLAPVTSVKCEDGIVVLK